VFAESLAPFFDTAGFAITATLAGQSVRGIYDREYAEASLGFGAAAGGRSSFILPSSTAGIAIGAVLVVPGAGTFKVAEIQPDGTGVTQLFLEKSA
jgi:hypothetical protein